MPTAVIILIIIGGFAVVVYGMWVFDRLVSWEREHHREQWERDGKPVGIFWGDRRARFWSGDRANKRLQILWLFRTPDWIAANRRCCGWLLQMRLAAAACCLFVLVIWLRLIINLLSR